jgi:hypothetical protein
MGVQSCTPRKGQKLAEKSLAACLELGWAEVGPGGFIAAGALGIGVFWDELLGCGCHEPCLEGVEADGGDSALGLFVAVAADEGVAIEPAEPASGGVV